MNERNRRLVVAAGLALAACTLAASCSFDYEPRSDGNGSDPAAAPSTRSATAEPTASTTTSASTPSTTGSPSTTAEPSTTRATPSTTAATATTVRRFRLPEPPTGYLAASVEIDEGANFTVVYPTRSDGEPRADGARLSIETLTAMGQNPAEGHEVISTHVVRDGKSARFFRVAGGGRYGMTWTEDASSAVTIYAARPDASFYVEVAAALQS